MKFVINGGLWKKREEAVIRIHFPIIVLGISKQNMYCQKCKYCQNPAKKQGAYL